MLLLLAACAVLAVVRDWGGAAASAALLVDGIDAFLSSKYGAGGGDQSFAAFVARSQGRRKDHARAAQSQGLVAGLFARELGLTAPRSSAASTGDGDGGDVGTISSLKQEEALDAAANAFSMQARQPCAGKPCFAVIDDPRFRGVHSGK